MQTVLVATKNLGRHPESIYYGLTDKQKITIKKYEKILGIGNNIPAIINLINNVKKYPHKYK